MKKVLVTGADGFVGSHLTEILVEKGYDVRAFILYNSFNSYGWLDKIKTETKEAIDFFIGDIRDSLAVAEAVKGCDTVLHLAALVAIPYSYHSPCTYVDTNIQGTLNMLQAARDAGVECFVHTSTSEVYGSAQSVPINETHPLQAQSPYAATKIGADQMALSFYRSFDLPVAILRPFNIYGPRQSARAVIPTIVSQIAANKTIIKLGNLSPTRDFTFVRDTVQGFIDIAHCDKAIGQCVNIGSRFEITIGDLAYLIADVMGKKIEVIEEDTRIRPEKSEVDRLFAGTALAEELFHWSPQYGGIEGFKKGLAITAKWFTAKENLARYKPTQYNI